MGGAAKMVTHPLKGKNWLKLALLAGGGAAGAGALGAGPLAGLLGSAAGEAGAIGSTAGAGLGGLGGANVATPGLGGLLAGGMPWQKMAGAAGQMMLQNGPDAGAVPTPMGGYQQPGARGGMPLGGSVGLSALLQAADDPQARATLLDYLRKNGGLI